MINIKLKNILLLSFLILGSPAIAQSLNEDSFASLNDSSDERSDEDTLLAVNQIFYGFNEALDAAIIKPAAQTYKKVMPSIAKRGVTNFFNNINDINVVVNDLLQLKLRKAYDDSRRFLVNLTWSSKFVHSS